MASNYYWLKLYYEMLDDPKIFKLRTHLRWRFIECLLVAGENNKEGDLPNPNEYAWRVRADTEMIETDFAQLAEAGLLSQNDGQWKVTKFYERQTPITHAERQKEYRNRERKKEYKNNQSHQNHPKPKTPHKPIINNELPIIKSDKPKETVDGHRLLPFHLQTPLFLNEWGEWMQHHTDMGRPLTPGAIKEQVKLFNEWGEDKSVAAMKYSRSKNWIGLVPEKEETNEQRYTRSGARSKDEHGLAPEPTEEIEYVTIELPPDHPARNDFPV